MIPDDKFPRHIAPRWFIRVCEQEVRDLEEQERQGIKLVTLDEYNQIFEKNYPYWRESGKHIPFDKDWASRGYTNIIIDGEIVMICSDERRSLKRQIPYMKAAITRYEKKHPELHE